MRRIGIYSEREEEAVTMTVTDKKKNNAFWNCILQDFVGPTICQEIQRSKFPSLQVKGRQREPKHHLHWWEFDDTTDMSGCFYSYEESDSETLMKCVCVCVWVWSWCCFDVFWSVPCLNTFLTERVATRKYNAWLIIHANHTIIVIILCLSNTSATFSWFISVALSD
jgi:hypothetical protein